MKRLRIYAIIIFSILISYSINAQTLVNWDITNGYSKKASLETNRDEGLLKFSINLQDIENHFYIVGLGADLELEDLSRMEYGFLVRYDELYITERGEMVGMYGRLAAGENLTIAKKGADIVYLRNDEEIHTSSSEGHEHLFPMATSFREADAVPSVEREASNSTAPPPPPPSDDDDKHWSHTKVFDGNGTSEANVISESRSYYDNLGRVQQVQSKYFTKNQVLASEPVYDAYGRAVGQTLVAPTGQADIQYKSDFFLNENGQHYSYQDFDNPTANSTASGGFMNPKPVGEQPNTVGWYYSNNNTLEEYVPDSDYPFSTYRSSPDGNFVMSSGVGEHHKMGSGNEYKAFSLSPSTELEYLYGYKRSYEVKDDGTALNPVSKHLPKKLQAIKRVTIGENGEEFIAFYSLSGQMLASAVSNAPAGANNCSQTQKATYTMYGRADRATNVHIPNGKKGTVQLTFSMPVVPSELVFKIVKLETYELLVEGTDYQINHTGTSGGTANGNNGYTEYNIAFLGAEAQGSGFYKFSYDVNSIPDGYGVKNHRPPHAYITCETDYSNWTLNYYNSFGQLMKSIAPKGVDCTYDAGAVNINNTPQLVYADYGSWFPTKDLLTIAVPSPSGNYNTGVVEINITPPNHNEFTRLPGWGIISHPLGAKFEDPEQLGLGYNGEPLLPIFVSIKKSFMIYGESGGTLTALHKFDETTEATRQRYEINAGGNMVDRYAYKIQYPFEAKHFRFTDEDMIGFDNIVVRIVDMQFAYYGSNGYMPFDPNDAFHLDNMNKVLAPGIVGYWSVYQSSEIPHDYQNTYHYDEKGLLIAEQDPDRGLVEYIYDDEYKLRFSQDAQQRDENKYSYIIYDERSRVVEAGVYKPDANTGSLVEVYNIPFPLSYYNDLSATTNSPTPNAYTIRNDDGGLQLPVANRQNRNFISYDETDLTGGVVQTGYTQAYLGGRVAKTWNDKNATYYSYNHKGQLAFTVQDIQNGIGKKAMDYEYDFFGKLTRKTYERGKSEEFAHIYTYDRDGQLVRVETDNGTVVKQTEYEYYTHGALKRTELGNKLQGLDYVYTITGALKSINHPFINRTIGGNVASYNSTAYDPGKDGFSGENSNFARDVFGMTIDYYAGDYQRANSNIQTGATSIESLGITSLPQEHYDGRIKGIRWNTAGSNDASGDAQNMWLYEYDWKGQLSQATFGTFQYRNTPQAWTFTESNDYRVHGLTYDDNGNLLTLKRNDKDGNIMDDLAYEYENTDNNSVSFSKNTNKLNRVIDAAGHKNSEDVASQVVNNYLYNKNGGIILDKEKSIQISYHANGKAEYIYNTNSTTLKVSYTYNERGERLTKSQHDANGNVEKTTYYVREISGAVVSIYEKEVTSNTIEQTEIPVASVGMYYVQQDQYVYQVTDHLGNVRATISDTKINGAAVVLSYADYYPFGMTMAGRNMTSSPEYRLSYQGQEMDKEVGGAGFYAFELRHYDARLGKWLSADPYEQHWSPYLAMSNNPISFIDPDGGQDLPEVVITGSGTSLGYYGPKLIDYQYSAFAHQLSFVTTEASLPGRIVNDLGRENMYLADLIEDDPIMDDAWLGSKYGDVFVRRNDRAEKQDLFVNNNQEEVRYYEEVNKITIYQPFYVYEKEEENGKKRRVKFEKPLSEDRRERYGLTDKGYRFVRIYEANLVTTILDNQNTNYLYYSDDPFDRPYLEEIMNEEKVSVGLDGRLIDAGPGGLSTGFFEGSLILKPYSKQSTDIGSLKVKIAIGVKTETDTKPIKVYGDIKLEYASPELLTLLRKNPSYAYVGLKGLGAPYITVSNRFRTKFSFLNPTTTVDAAPHLIQTLTTVGGKRTLIIMNKSTRERNTIRTNKEKD